MGDAHLKPLHPEEGFGEPQPDRRLKSLNNPQSLVCGGTKRGLVDSAAAQQSLQSRCDGSAGIPREQ